jgi:hypothetical protein
LGVTLALIVLNPNGILINFNNNILSIQKHNQWASGFLEYDDIETANLKLLIALNDLEFSREDTLNFSLFQKKKKKGLLCGLRHNCFAQVRHIF